MFLEAFHWVFKRIYLGSQISKRLDCCLVNMVKLSCDKAFDRAIKLTKKKHTYCLSNFVVRHRQSLQIHYSSVEKVTGDRWLVTSQNSKQNHVVCRVALICIANDQCKMVCPNCEVCPHIFQSRTHQFQWQNMMQYLHIYLFIYLQIYSDFPQFWVLGFGAIFCGSGVLQFQLLGSPKQPIYITACMAVCVVQPLNLIAIYSMQMNLSRQWTRTADRGVLEKHISSVAFQLN